VWRESLHPSLFHGKVDFVFWRCDMCSSPRKSQHLHPYEDDESSAKTSITMHL
jgi:hypothetical protein